MRKLLLGAGLAVALLSGGAAAQLPQGPIVQPQLPPGTPTPQIQPTCMVDLAITSIRLNKLSQPGSATVEVEVTNLGPSTWNSAAGQQQVNLVVHNNNTNNDFTLSVPFGGRRVARNGRAALVRSPAIANAFDAHEFAGTVQASLAFDPDIAIDGNACNDDRNAANNSFGLTTEQVWGFLSGTPRTQLFRR
ncbi:MAG: hypothetical protein AB7H66_08060 [Hyphomonadaceae bacterium]